MQNVYADGVKNMMSSEMMFLLIFNDMDAEKRTERRNTKNEMARRESN